MSARDFGLYVILGQTHHDHVELASICVRRKVRMVQLREKGIADKDLLLLAQRIAEVTRDTETSFFVNDRVDIALLSGADGVHLGQDDLAYDDAVRLAGNHSLRIGLSTHSIEQARSALLHKPDYIGFGPLWATTTKINHDPVTGLEPLREVLSFADCPVVAIGGIFPENLEQVVEAGARNVCLVRYIMQADDPEGAIAALQQRLEKIQ